MTSCLIKSWLLSWRGCLDLIWLFFLLLLLHHFWKERRFLQRTQSWLITKGHITQLEWTQEESRLWPKIEYSYEIFDREFLGEHLMLDTSHNTPTSHHSRSTAYRVAMAFKHNEEIDVFYNPNNPYEATLDITIPPKLGVIIGLLVTLVFIHLISIIYYLCSLHPSYIPKMLTPLKTF